MVGVIKTQKEREADTKFLERGIGIKDIPTSSKKQKIGLNIGGGIIGKVSKKNDPFRRENWGF